MNLNEQHCYFQRCQKRNRNRNRREIIQHFFFLLSSGFYSLVLVDFNHTVFDHISLETKFDLAWYFHFFKVIEIRSFLLFLAPQQAD